MVRKLLMVFGVVAAFSPLLLPLFGMANAAPAQFPGQAATTGKPTCPNPCPVQATDSNGGNNVFTPKIVTVTAGTVINFTNTGTAAHTATSDTGAAVTFDSGNLNPGATYSTTMPAAGGVIITYHCTYHQSLGMVGTIVVLGPGNAIPTAPATSASPPPSSDELPSPTALPTPVPSQKYFPKIGGGLLVIALVGIAFGYIKTKRKLQDKG